MKQHLGSSVYMCSATLIRVDAFTCCNAESHASAERNSMQVLDKAAGGGLTEEELAELRALLDTLPPERRERCLLPFLEAQQGANHKLHCILANKGMLRCLSGAAPACVFMRPPVIPHMRRLLQVCLAHVPCSPAIVISIHYA